MPSGSFTLSVSVSVDYMVIRVRCYSIDQNIEYYEYQHADCRYDEQKREIIQVEGQKQIFYHRNSKPKKVLEYLILCGEKNINQVNIDSLKNEL